MNKAQITVERKWNIKWREDGLCAVNCPGPVGFWGSTCQVFGVKRRSPKAPNYPAVYYRCTECIAATEANK